MKVLVFGSLNIDHTYRLAHLVRAGETLASGDYARSEGGKGLNQAVALARAGRETYFAGAIGEDGAFLKDFLALNGVNTAYIATLPVPTGHAIIQVDDAGQNAILLFSGANGSVSREQVLTTLDHFDAGDAVLLQNEINQLDFIMTEAARRGMRIILNPSPITPALLNAPLHLTDTLILNEIEGKDITGETPPEAILDALRARYPACHIVLTLGERGAFYADQSQRMYQAALPVEAADTTAAGDTFTGFFLHRFLTDGDAARALREAACAAALAVSRKGAARSIPSAAETARFPQAE